MRRTFRPLCSPGDATSRKAASIPRALAKLVRLRQLCCFREASQRDTDPFSAAKTYPMSRVPEAIHGAKRGL